MKFRKKPIEVEAVQYDGTPLSCHQIVSFTSNSNTPAFLAPKRPHAPGFVLTIRTREGVMAVSPGDWVIRGVAGEHYPCKPDIFAATYEPVPDGSALGGANAEVGGGRTNASG